MADTRVDSLEKEVARGRTERAALAGLLIILVVLPLGLLGYQFALRPAVADARTVEIVAAAPEAGGFRPDAIRVAAGERVRLRFSAPDVTHGIALGPGLGLDLGHVDPGEVQEVEVTFDRPGRYTFYCNTWCSPSHWRMRGVIEVYDPKDPGALPPADAPDPVLQAMAARQVDIDAPHEAEVVPATRPSAARGVDVVLKLGESLPAELEDAGWRRFHSPVEAGQLLKQAGLDDAHAWDAVAYLWLVDLDGNRLKMAESLYAKNCAACHGQTGDGQGPGATALDASLTRAEHESMDSAKAPAAFADPAVMLGGSSEVYYAKLRRGGMGTGMPSFGPILTPEETWTLVDYLWTFVFDRGEGGGPPGDLQTPEGAGTRRIDRARARSPVAAGATASRAAEGCFPMAGAISQELGRKFRSPG
jgi:mono/diheme cytochrome c family protein/plastocyanin